MSASPKHMPWFLDESDTEQWLREFPYICWSQHDACLSTVLASYRHLLSTVDHLQTYANHRCDDTAASLTRAMESSDFLVSITVCQRLWPYVTPLRNALQAPSCHLVKAGQQATNLISLLEKKESTAPITIYGEKAYARVVKVEITVLLLHTAKPKPRDGRSRLQHLRNAGP